MIVATICVRDEEEIIGQCIEHHLSCGVDKIIVTDNGSVDRTRDILESYPVIIIDQPTHDYQHGKWVTHMARLAYKLGATWVMNIDADEFWYDFTFAYEATTDVIYIQPNYDYIPMLSAVQGQFVQSDHIFWTRCPVITRMMHRAMPDVVVCDGNHHIESTASEAFDPRIYFKHYSIRSYEQFEKKVIKGGTSLEKSPQSLGQSTHWRKWYSSFQQGNLFEIYKELAISNIVDTYYAGKIQATILL